MWSSGTDFLQLDPGNAPARGLTTWLTDGLRAAIMNGRLCAGTSLPPTRALASDLGISRGVVVEAYQRLKDEGLVSGLTGAGTRVSAAARPAGSLAAAGPLAQTGPVAAAGPVAGARSVAGGLGVPAPGVLPRPWRAAAEIDLSPGVPDLSGFPRAAWLRAERTVLAHAGTADLGYGDPRGSEWLRTELAGWLARTRGLSVSPDEIIIVTGVAQALTLLAQWLLRSGGASRGIAMEDPGSRGTRDLFAYWGLPPVPVAVDSQGLVVADLAATDVRAVVLTPAHQFPTGAVLAPERRRALLSWAAARGGLVVEDDYDAEYRYDRSPVPALQASAPGLVIYAGSTSKTLAPGMRLGWLIPPRDMHADLVAAKHAADLGSPALPQLVLAQLIASGALEQHIRLVRKRQRSRRDALLTALRSHLPEAQIEGIGAGLHLLVTFPSLAGATDTDLAERVLQAGVLVHPLSWHCQRDTTPGFVLGYAVHTPDQMHEAVQRIAKVIGPDMRT
jgi:GntR family transcriptional regulator/MocR family aminotransferase